MKKHKKLTNHSRSGYYMYGKHAVLSALKNEKRIINGVYCLEKFFQEHKNLLGNFPVEIVQNDFILKKIGKDHPHQGIIADVETIFVHNIEELNFNEGIDKIAILDQISDPQNIGAIIRSAAAFGVNKIIMPSDNTPDENATIAKSACGCLELIQLAKVVNLKAAIDKLKKKGFWIAGLTGTGTNNINDILKIEKIAVIIGSEDQGMRKLTTEACDFLVKIPISPEVESLNASNAACIIFHSLCMI